MASNAPKVDIGSKLMFVISAVALLAVVYVLVSSLINTFQRNSTKGEIDNTQLVLSVEENLKPIGVSAAAGEVVAGAAGRSGKEIYDAVCTSCHATGVLDSPKLGDKAAWESRAANGLDGLIATAAKGVGSMPAKGGDPSITDSELKAVILYMTKESGIDLGSAEEAPAKETPAKEEVTKAEPKASVEEAALAAVTATSAPAASGDGKKVYDTACFACHATGVAGSPKLGDKGAWAPRIAQGAEALYTTALKGKGAMPPKGGNMALEDDKVKAAVDYMVNQSQ